MKNLIRGLLLVIIMLFMTACQKQVVAEEGTAYKIYYVNHEETGIFYKEYRTTTKEQSALLEELIASLSEIPAKLEYKAPLGGQYSLLSYDLVEDGLTLSFDENYRNQPITTEILVRAAIVRTLTQIDGIQYVSFLIRNDPMTDALGNVIGVMNAETFIDNTGNEINTYEKAKLTLFFANENGDKLRSVNRTVVYNSNIPVERLVIEQLLAGPAEDEAAYPVLNPETKIISVNVKDGICYVNLGATFLTQIYNVTSEATIYSLTNSLVELPNINKVQISINGDTNVVYKENINFSTIFERNLEIVE